MGDIKRGITSISDLKKGSTNVNFVYRGANLVWQRTTPTTLGYVADGMNFNLNKQAPTNSYIVDGINFVIK